MNRLLFVLLLPALLGACGPSSGAGDQGGQETPASSSAPPLEEVEGIPLEVHNSAEVPMDSRVVSVGVPFPAHRFPIVGDPRGLFVVVDGQGNLLPTQVRTLARWHGTRDQLGKPVKWMLVSFPASVPANGVAHYELRAGIPPAASLEVVDELLVVRVRPRPGVEIVIDKDAFHLARGVTLGGVPLVATQDGVRFIDELGNQRPVYVTDTVIEEQGSLRAVICQKGMIGDLGFTCRREFSAGSAGMVLDFRLENPGPYGLFSGAASQHVHFDSLSLEIAPQQAIQRVVSEQELVTVGAQDYELRQGYSLLEPRNLLSNFWFDESVGGTSLGTGGRYQGALAVESSQGAILVAVDRFWQNFPKAFRADAQTLSIDLWPSWGNGPEFSGQYSNPWVGNPVEPLAIDNYRFEGGRWKTHRIHVAFLGTAVNPAEVRDFAAFAQAPCAARPAPSWTRRTMATGLPWMERREWNHSGLDRYERLHDMTASDAAADDLPQLGRLGLPAFRNMGGTPGGRQWYGWENYGDLPWGEGYSSLHYDWPLNTLLNWYRGGAVSFFHEGRDMAWHRRDYDQNHSVWGADSWTGAQFYEKGHWHGNSNPGAASHTWIHGVLLHYAMTGDEGSFEAAQEAKDFFLSHSPAQWGGYWGARIPGWTTENLLDCYNYLGDPACLTEIRGGLAAWEALETQSGHQGYVINAGIGDTLQPWMQSIYFNAAARYALTTGDLSYQPLLARMMDFFRGPAFVPGWGPENARHLPSTWSFWSPQTGGSGTSLHLLWPLLDSYCYGTFLFGRSDDLDRARELFEVLTHFHQSPSGATVDLNDPAQWSDLSFRMLQYPNSESKVLANIHRWGRGYTLLHALAEGLW